MNKLNLGKGLQAINAITVVKDIRVNNTHSASLAHLYIIYICILPPEENKCLVEGSWASVKNF